MNVHGYFTEEVLPNGNRPGIGVVIRNHQVRLLRLYGVSLCIEERHINELYAMLQGLLRDYLDEHYIID